MDIIERMEKRDELESNRQSFGEYISGKHFSIVLAASVCLLLLIGGILYVSLGRVIYFWDDATYWEMSRFVAGGGLGGNFWSKVYNSISEMDYNYVAALPSAAWTKLFGTSRTAYVAGLTVMYEIPSVLLVFAMARKLSKAPNFAFAAVILMMPVTMYLTFNGFIDVGGVLIGLVCYNLYYTKDGVTDKWYRYAIIGVLLVMVMVFRRYFAFFSVSFFTAMAADRILYRPPKKNIIITGAVVALLLCTVFLPFLTGILLKNYGSLYSGYKYDIGTDMKLITRYFGLIFLVLMLCVPLISAIKRREMRPIFVLIQILVCAAMFMSTQTHGQQHLRMYVPALAVLIMFAVNCIDNKLAIAAVCALALVNFGSIFIDRVQPTNIQEIESLSPLPSFSVKPERRNDTRAILKLKQDLDQTVEENAKCRVLASSFVLNDSIIRNAPASLNVPEERDGSYIVSLPEVDSRDFWRLNEIYEAEYILLASPPQTHLGPGEQTITEQAVESFMNNTDIAQIFEEITDFRRYIGNMEIRLYRRTGNMDLIRKNQFESRLYNN